MTRYHVFLALSLSSCLVSPIATAEDGKDLGLQLPENPPMQVHSKMPPELAPIAEEFGIREGFQLVETLDEFRAVIKEDNQKIRMKPGIYRAETVDPPMKTPVSRAKPDQDGNLPKNNQEHLFAVNGSNNHYLAFFGH